MVQHYKKITNYLDTVQRLPISSKTTRHKKTSLPQVCQLTKHWKQFVKFRLSLTFPLCFCVWIQCILDYFLFKIFFIHLNDRCRCVTSSFLHISQVLPTIVLRMKFDYKSYFNIFLFLALKSSPKYCQPLVWEGHSWGYRVFLLAPVSVHYQQQRCRLFW